MDFKRGFVTVATGRYYCWLAENLAMSYRLFSSNKYPIYVMTDLAGAERLSKIFDGVIVLDKPQYSFLDKILVYENTVFDETIFLDADMNIVDDITFLFDEFEKNGSEVSCIGTYKEITKEQIPNHFGMKAVERFGLKGYISFGGGVYYFRKSAKTQQCMDFIFGELIPNYKKYELEYFGNNMADEPLMELAMLVYNMKPFNLPIDIMRFSDDMMQTLQWDMGSRKARFVWHGRKALPLILHYGTHNTYSKEYVYYNTLLRCKYYRTWKIFIPLRIIVEEIRLFFRLAANEKRRKAFYQWVLAHFTIEHFKYRISQIQKLCRKGLWK